MRLCSPKISVVIFAEGLQDDGDGCHDGFNNTELESRLEDTRQFRVALQETASKGTTNKGGDFRIGLHIKETGKGSGLLNDIKPFLNITKQCMLHILHA